MADVPLVSVIVPTYNRAALLERSLRSVGQQDYTSMEIVVVDDVSTDETAAVVKRLSAELGDRGVPVHFVRLSANSGPAFARNRGVEKTAGSLLAFLDSDDLLEATFVSTIVALLRRYPHCVLGFCEAWRIDPDDRKIGRLESGLPRDPGQGILHTPLDELARRELFQTAGVLLRREAFEAAGGFDETLRYSEDTDLWWRLAKEGDFAYTVEPLVSHRYHAENVSKNADALGDSIRVHLRHLVDLRNPVSRSAHTERIHRRQVLLQEKLLRDLRPSESYRDLLDASVHPASLRFRIGRRVARGPFWFRRMYLAVIRLTRATRRVITGGEVGDFSNAS